MTRELVLLLGLSRLLLLTALPGLALPGTAHAQAINSRLGGTAVDLQPPTSIPPVWRFVAQGKILHPAASNFAAWQVCKALWTSQRNGLASLVCIQDPYNLRSSYWQPVELTPTLLNQMVYRMETVYSLEPRGAWILDSRGRRLGLWYSYQRWTKVKVDENNEVMVVPPKAPDFGQLR